MQAAFACMSMVYHLPSAYSFDECTSYVWCRSLSHIVPVINRVNIGACFVFCFCNLWLSAPAATDPCWCVVSLCRVHKGWVIRYDSQEGHAGSTGRNSLQSLYKLVDRRLRHKSQWPLYRLVLHRSKILQQLQLYWAAAVTTCVVSLLVACQSTECSSSIHTASSVALYAADQLRRLAMHDASPLQNRIIRDGAYVQLHAVYALFYPSLFPLMAATSSPDRLMASCPPGCTGVPSTTLRRQHMHGIVGRSDR